MARYLLTNVAAILKTVTAPSFFLSIFLKAVTYYKQDFMYRFVDKQSHNSFSVGNGNQVLFWERGTSLLNFENNNFGVVAMHDRFTQSFLCSFASC